LADRGNGFIDNLGRIAPKSTISAAAAQGRYAAAVYAACQSPLAWAVLSA
jgi:hypothetical protein